MGENPLPGIGCSHLELSSDGHTASENSGVDDPSGPMFNGEMDYVAATMMHVDGYPLAMHSHEG